MTRKMLTVSVRQLPESLDAKQGKRFLSELEECINVDRPRIVLDCSKVRHMGRPAVHVLLCCLEEAMKRNGDVKLAALPPDARAVLEFTGADRLFETFDTMEDAVEGFYHRGLLTDSHPAVSGLSPAGAENAA
jgi:anti-sigma B factor antagonist